MRTTLAIFSVLFWVLGLGTCAIGGTAQTATTGSLFIATGTMCFVGLCIVNTLNSLRQKPPPPPHG